MVTQTELFRFTEANSSEIWTYTSGDETVTYDAGDGDEDYIPARLLRDEIEIRSEVERANITIRTDLDNPAAVKWLQDDGELLVGLTVFGRDEAGTISTVWKGRLSAVLPDMSSIRLSFESVFTSLRRPGLRALYQRSCRHALYGRGCRLDAGDFETAASCTASSGDVLTVTEAALQANGYYTGGMIRSPDGVLSYIINHVGTAVTIQRLSKSLVDEIENGFPFSVTLYPGCDHSRTTCRVKFDNLLNYGGFDWIPSKNPMGGDSIV